MDTEPIKILLLNSFSNLISKNGILSIEDIKLDVINQACYYYILLNKENPNLDITTIAVLFTQTAAEIIDKYSDTDSLKSIIEIQNKYNWPPLWDVLREYFQTKHGVSIDAEPIRHNIFHPSQFKRIENNVVTQDYSISHTLDVTFIGKTHQRIKIVFPIGVKTGSIQRIESKRDCYKGDEIDYNISVVYIDESKLDISTIIIHQTKSKADFYYIK